MRFPLIAALRALLSASGLALALCLAATAQAATAPRLDDLRLPATGSHETLVHIPVFGRYTLLAASRQGTALQLVDRMAGPGPVSGSAGARDGRLDLFLDQGTYKLRTYASSHGNGEVELAVRAARELSPNPAPRLTEFRLESSELDDFQQRSWWLEIGSRRTVALEAAGRNLADLRLWRDGNWLVDATPTSLEVEPTPGKPLSGRQLVTTLEPGLYLLMAYGGPALPWADTSDEHPLYLRFGIPTLPEAGRRLHTASPFGVDRWRIPASADFFRLELPSAESADLTISDYREQQPYAGWGSQAAITKKSVPPVVELRTGSYGQGERLITVRREAGKPYLLQHFHARQWVSVTNPGNYWVSTLNAGNGEDEADATGILSVLRYGERYWHYQDNSAIRLGPGQAWQRRFNLLADSTLFFDVKADGEYAFEAEGVDAELRLEPFLVDYPRNYRPPNFERGRLERRLDAGLYVLTLQPRAGDNGKGIITLRAGLTGELPGKEVASPAQPGARFTPLAVGSREVWRLDLNARPGVTSGILVRALPVDLGEALPVAQAAGETLDLPIRVPETGTVNAIAEDGRHLPFAINRGAPTISRRLAPGRYSLTLANAGEQAIHYTLTFTPLTTDPSTPLPPISPQALAARPVFQVLGSQRPLPVDLARSETRTFNLAVKEPALYRVETTGLLATEGTLRTRVDTRLASAAENGIGRNFLIGHYLRQGDYQLSIQPRGQSEGHLTVRLAQTTLHDGGSLLAGLPARASLAAGEGLLYRFHIDQPGRYRLRALGLDRRFTVRLEDGDGWPLLRPGIDADLTHDFAPGNYRLVVLPQTVDAQVVTLLEAEREPPRFEGHGPHRIELGQRVAHRWLEPAEGESRQPDQWQFTAPAAIDARIALSAGMAGELVLDGETLAGFDGEKGWEGALEAGDYTLSLKSRRPNNRLDYRFTITSRQLVAGQRRTISTPVDLPIAVGSERPFELSSFGDEDVRATLYDAAGNRLAGNDDRTDDWNFLLTAQLAPGQYRLRIDPVARSSAMTEVSFRVPDERQETPLTLPSRHVIEDTAIHYYPLPPAVDDRLLIVQAHSADSVGLAIERQSEDGAWRTTGQRAGKDPLLAAPTSAGDRLRVRAWSISRTGQPIALAIDRVTGARFSEAHLSAAGVPLKPVPGFAPALAVAAVMLEHPGQLQVEGGNGDLLVGTEAGAPLFRPERGRIPASSRQLWLLRPQTGAGATRIRLQRQVLDAGAPLTANPTTQPAWVDLPPLADGHIQLLIAQSPAATQGLRLGPGASVAGQLAPGRLATALIRRSPGAAAVEVSNSGEAEAAGLPVSLRLFDFAVPPSAPLRVGRHDVKLPAGRALHFDLPGGTRPLALTLPAGVVAELRRGEASVSTVWPGLSEAAGFALEGDADTLLLYNTAAADALLSLHLGGESAAAAAITGGQLGRFHHAAAGTRELAVRLTAEEKRQGRRLHAFGDDIQLTAIETSGTICQGNGLLLHDDARLLVEHPPGLLLLWLSAPDGSTTFGEAGETRRVTLPAQLAFEGATTALDFEQPEPGGVVLSADLPAVVRVRAAGLPERLHVFPAATALPLYLPAGRHSIRLDPLATGTGQAALRAVTPEPLQEGLNPKRLLGPGDSRLYRFTLPAAQAIGLGVRASRDVVGSVLLDAGGTELGRGLVQMHELPAGDYLLRVEAPADGEAVEVQPALVGSEAPDTGPPDAVIREYLDQR